MKRYKLHEERVDTYVKRLVKDLGIKKLGSGVYSTVFQHPVYHNVAVKLCNEQDIKTILYLKMAMKHPENPWFPKIVSIHPVNFHDANFLGKDDIDGDVDNHLLTYVTHIIFMQKLKPCTRNDYVRAGDKIFNTLPDTCFELPYPPRTTLTFKQYREAVRDIDEYNASGVPWLVARKDVTLDEVMPGDWKKVAANTNDPMVKQLAVVLDKIRADDIHIGNVMLSPDGHPVITDPVAS